MSFESRDFRDALGVFATGVCVITASPEGGAPFGLTVNSFASVSLDPPLILWSLQNDSDMYGAFEQGRHWAVNILRGDQQDLSNQYARKGDHALDPGHFEITASGMPVMPESLVSFECEVEARYPGGDHVILVGRVLEMHHRASDSPLVFCAGSYAELAS
ncbi:MAG: flavin reductase family protein [Halieaceae bacterium]